MVRRAIWDTRSPGYNYHIDRCPDPCVSGSLRWGDFCSPQYPGPIARLLCLEPFEEAVSRPALVAVVRVEDKNRGVLQHRHHQQPAALDPDREEYPVGLLPLDLYRQAYLAVAPHGTQHPCLLYQTAIAALTTENLEELIWENNLSPPTMDMIGTIITESWAPYFVLPSEGGPPGGLGGVRRDTPPGPGPRLLAAAGGGAAGRHGFYPQPEPQRPTPAG